MTKFRAVISTIQIAGASNHTEERITIMTVSFLEQNWVRAKQLHKLSQLQVSP